MVVLRSLKFLLHTQQTGNCKTRYFSEKIKINVNFVSSKDKKTPLDVANDSGQLIIADQLNANDTDNDKVIIIVSNNTIIKQMKKISNEIKRM